uniref:Uncharacterized protein n=1 Tax=Trypanosoma congolense (strain IL3000) TaxID=1068625 RepID=G0UM15_TRYCI|nr:hypothetical protein, unlikely [Trypanosoma congolense IL3000]
MHHPNYYFFTLFLSSFLSFNDLSNYFFLVRSNHCSRILGQRYRSKLSLLPQKKKGLQHTIRQPLCVALEGQYFLLFSFLSLLILQIYIVLLSFFSFPRFFIP